MRIEQFNFGTSKDQQDIFGFTISNKKDLSISVINWGATLISVKSPDKNGKIEELTLGFDNIGDYEEHSPYFGSTVGRVANRIADGRFSIGEVNYQLEKNEKGINHLHGGLKGISKIVWDLETKEGDKASSIICRYRSVDGEEGYPGNLDVQVEYTLTEANELMIEYQATTDKTCPINLTNHAYWNLCGDKTDSILGHDLNLQCESYLPVDENLIPTGEIKSVSNTPFDFRTTKQMGKDLEAAGGYDHCYVIGMEKTECKQFAKVFEPTSGREMSVATTEPGVQFYSGNFLFRKEEQGFNVYDGFCLETQFFPDSVNQKSFPSVLLEPGDIYRQKTVHTFSIR